MKLVEIFNCFFFQCNIMKLEIILDFQKFLFIIECCVHYFIIIEGELKEEQIFFFGLQFEDYSPSR